MNFTDFEQALTYSEKCMLLGKELNPNWNLREEERERLRQKMEEGYIPESIRHTNQADSIPSSVPIQTTATAVQDTAQTPSPTVQEKSHTVKATTKRETPPTFDYNKLNLSSNVLHDAFRITYDTLGAWETGRRKPPIQTQRMLLFISAVLNDSKVAKQNAKVLSDLFKT